ncbi:MAG TPA: protein kinase [Pseudolysinimonas sp.]|nr:protein kinase [Pseudolysinimonas sp.]
MTLDVPIAGIPPLRLLAAGTRSRVWLAPGDRVLKVVETGAEAIAEATALQRAVGEHVVDLLDVAIDDDEAVLVLPRLPRGSLGQLLERREGLDAGEAVTVLAPIAAGLARLHAAGVAHRAVCAEHILFREDGAPVLIGFGSAHLFESGLPQVARDGVDAVADDRRDMCALADIVLRRVTGRRAAAAIDLAERLARAGAADVDSVLSSEIFELAAARPVRFDADEESAAPARVIGLAAPPAAAGPATGMLAQVMESGPGRLVRETVTRRWHSWSARRRRVVLAAASGAAVLVVAALAIPPTPPTVASGEGGPVHPAPAPQPAETSVASSGAQVTGDDPLAALPALLARRTECFRDLAELCLPDVDEPGSSAFTEDRAALNALIEHAEQPELLEATGAKLVQRLGDSALIALAPETEPASLLLVKGEAGWRIRDYLAGADG